VKSSPELTNTSFVQQVPAYPILRSQFNNLYSVEVLAKREAIWERSHKGFDKTPITYAHFGVFRGDSLAYFSENNSAKDSIFLWLNSFEGLPEAWAGSSD